MAAQSGVALNASKERKAITFDGGPMLLLLVAALAAIVYFGPMRLFAVSDPSLVAVAPLAASILAFLLIAVGFYTLQINEAAVVTLFDNYKGTDRKAGLRWIYPWYKRSKVSMRVRNLVSEKLKVNDKRGNPIEIAAVIVWRVQDSAQAKFDVDDYSSFVNVQVETAIRELASHFAYDHGEEMEPTLRGDADEVSEQLKARVQERVAVAGLSVDEARLTHLAYAPEIASAMLRRQQAEAILAARQKIVAGAVSMVESALHQISEREIVTLDNERRAAMVSNLLVVLCADQEAQPVINAGTLYQ